MGIEDWGVSLAHEAGLRTGGAGTCLDNRTGGMHPTRTRNDGRVSQPWPRGSQGLLEKVKMLVLTGQTGQELAPGLDPEGRISHNQKVLALAPQQRKVPWT